MVAQATGWATIKFLAVLGALLASSLFLSSCSGTSINNHGLGNTIHVNVTGAVETPGVHKLPVGSSVRDALEFARLDITSQHRAMLKRIRLYRISETNKVMRIEFGDSDHILLKDGDVIKVPKMLGL